MIAKAKLEQEPLVPFVQILGPDGTANPTDIVELGLKPHDFKTLYRWMVAGRLFDERALALQRQGRLGTYAPLLGQEAAQVGSAYALKPEDWLFPSYREHAALAMRGQSWLQLLMYWGGNEEGNRIPEGIRNFMVCVPIATQILHAVGAAWAAKLKGEKSCALVYFGDGATSEGDFHEGLNFAGSSKSPWSSSARTINMRSPCRAPDRRRPKPSPRRRSPTASKGSKLTATTSLPSIK
jgi:TPP-dependent pyruvate/acetoin dehydrogenase alpha subunit